MLFCQSPRYAVWPFMRIRFGIFDASATVVVLFAIFLPPRRPGLAAVYADHRPGVGREIAAAQAELAQHPQDGQAVQELARLLVEVREYGWALRVAGQAAARAVHANSWRVYLAISGVHAERLEIKPAHEWAEKAFAACGAPGATCAPYERVRVTVYADALKAGLDSGIDPRLDPDGFKRAIDRAFPHARMRGGPDPSRAP